MVALDLLIVAVLQFVLATSNKVPHRQIVPSFTQSENRIESGRILYLNIVRFRV